MDRGPAFGHGLSGAVQPGPRLYTPPPEGQSWPLPPSKVPLCQGCGKPAPNPPYPLADCVVVNHRWRYCPTCENLMDEKGFQLHNGIRMLNGLEPEKAVAPRKGTK